MDLNNDNIFSLDNFDKAQNDKTNVHESKKTVSDWVLIRAKCLAKKAEYEAKIARYKYKQMVKQSAENRADKNKVTASSEKKEPSFLKRMGEAIIKNAHRIVTTVVTAVAGCIAKVLTSKYRSRALT